MGIGSLGSEVRVKASILQATSEGLEALCCGLPPCFLANTFPKPPSSLVYLWVDKTWVIIQKDGVREELETVILEKCQKMK